MSARRSSLQATIVQPEQARQIKPFGLEAKILLTTGAPVARARSSKDPGRVKSNRLLKDQEAVCPQVVAGDQYAECYTTARWIDLISVPKARRPIAFR